MDDKEAEKIKKKMEELERKAKGSGFFRDLFLLIILVGVVCGGAWYFGYWPKLMEFAQQTFQTGKEAAGEMKSIAQDVAGIVKSEDDTEAEEN